MRLLILAVGLLWAEASLADTTVCTRDKKDRLVDVKLVDKGCEAWYRKPTEGKADKKIYYSKWDPKHCEAHAKHLVKKLKKQGWDCKADEPMTATKAPPGDVLSPQQAPAPESSP